MLYQSTYTREETQSSCEMSTSGPEDTQDYDKGVNVDTIKEALSESQELSDWTIAYASGDRSSNNVEGIASHLFLGTYGSICVY